MFFKFFTLKNWVILTQNLFQSFVSAPNGSLDAIQAKSLADTFHPVAPLNWGWPNWSPTQLSLSRFPSRNSASRTLWKGHGLFWCEEIVLNLSSFQWALLERAQFCSERHNLRAERWFYILSEVACGCTTCPDVHASPRLNGRARRAFLRHGPGGENA